MFLSEGKRGYCIFDYDDTIMSTRECKIAAIKEFGRRYFSKDVSTEDVEKLWGIAHHDLFAKLFSISDNDLDIALKRYTEMDEEFPLLPHTDSLAALSRLETLFDLVIVSSCERSLIEKQLDRSSLSAVRFRKIFGSGDTKYHKPSGKVFLEMFASFADANVENSVYVGDSIKDLVAANDAALPFCGVDRFDTETQKMVNEGGAVFPSLTAIAEHLVGTDAECG